MAQTQIHVEFFVSSGTFTSSEECIILPLLNISTAQVTKLILTKHFIKYTLSALK